MTAIVHMNVVRFRILFIGVSASLLHSVAQIAAFHIKSSIAFNIIVAILLPEGLFCTEHDLKINILIPHYV